MQFLNKFSIFALGVILAIAAPLFAQTAFPLFQPAAGILKGSTSTYVTTAAASSDVISLWSGTCNSGTVLAGDGSCVTPGASFPLLGSNGTNSAPTYSFSAATGTGLYRPAANAWGLAAGGTLTLSSTATDVTAAVKLFTPATATGGAGFNLPPGTAPSAPSNGDIWITSSGFYARVNGSTVGPLGAAVSYPLLAPNGSLGAPSFAFANDDDTGIWLNGVSDMRISNNGFLVLRNTGGTWTSPAPWVFSHIVSMESELTVNAAGGATELFVASGSTTFGAPLRAADGLIGTPSYSFTNDTDGGMWRSGTNAFRLSADSLSRIGWDASATTGDTAMLLYDVDNATLERVTVGAADSCGVGFKCLRIPN